MAGHSKWSNIKRRKAAQDQKRGKIFARHSKSIYTAAKEGGGNPDMNPALRLAIEKARADNMPNDNIDRAIQKATGTLDGAKFEEFIYEGYGPGGIAIIVEVVTDNRNRTAAEVRHAFSKNDGNLGESGSVSRQRFSFVIDSYRCSSNSTHTESGLSASITSFTCSALLLETWAVPTNQISLSSINRRVIFSSDIQFLP